MLCCGARMRNCITRLRPRVLDCCAGDSLVPRSTGENQYEKLENNSFAKALPPEIVRSASFLIDLRNGCFGPRQGSANCGGAKKSRTADRASTSSGAAESAAASALSSGHAQGRRSAQSFERGGLRGIVDTGGGGRSFVRGPCKACFREAADFSRRRGQATCVRRRQSRGGGCLQGSASV